MRSGWKPKYLDHNLQSLFLRNKNPKRPVLLKIFSRSSTITKSFLGRKVAVHQGKDFAKFTVKDYMVGHKFGEYSPTRLVGSDMHFRKKGKKPTMALGKKK